MMLIIDGSNYQNMLKVQTTLTSPTSSSIVTGRLAVSSSSFGCSGYPLTPYSLPNLSSTFPFRILLKLCASSVRSSLAHRRGSG
jgi:hypothetical protein